MMLPVGVAQVSWLGARITQGGRGQWAVYYTSPQSFCNKVILLVGSTTLETIIKVWLVGSLNLVSKFFNH